jgi:ABC-type nitrate/sulfonate/bicarbonate transport system permease component
VSNAGETTSEDIEEDKSGLFGSNETAKNRKRRRLITSLIVIFVGWELFGQFGIENRLFFAPLSEIAVSGYENWISGELQKHISASFQELLYGMLLATIFGIAFGILIAINQSVREHCDPIVSALYATPTVAIAPILITAFGLGIASKVAVVFLIAVFPIIINTTVGIRQTQESFIETAYSFNATRWQVIAKVLVPSSIPFVIAGIRLGVGRGIVGVVVGELFGADMGLGIFIFEAGQTFDAAPQFLGILILCFAGMALTGLLQWTEKKIAPWHHFALDEE